MAVTVQCVSVKQIKDYDEAKDDLGFDVKPEPAKAWLVKFLVDLKGKKIKPALTYETETEARTFSEGKTYSVVEWVQLAFG